jgi:hypothetical protein
LRANGSRECAPDDRFREAILSRQASLDCFVAEFIIGPAERPDPLAPRNDDDQATGRLAISAAIFRKQSRHRQSPPSTGIGKRAVSSVHQHGPVGLQVKSAPQPEQLRRRESGISNRFVMIRAEFWRCF